jgi:hypothetical protein
MISMAGRRFRRFRQFVVSNIFHCRPKMPSYTGGVTGGEGISGKKPTKPTNRRFPKKINELVSSVGRGEPTVALSLWLRCPEGRAAT